jgi:hypothetical protein
LSSTTHAVPLPEELQRELEMLRPMLERQGSFQRRNERKNSPWRIRIRLKDANGIRHQKSIHLGEEAVAVAARTLVNQWREERRRQDQAAERQREAALREKHELAAMRRNVIEAAGGGRRRRERVAREFDKAAKDPRRFLAYTLLSPWNAANRCPGRRPKSQLW